MADISPGQFPQTPSFQSVNFKINTPVITSETNAGKLRRVAQGHSYYTFEVKYPSVTASQLGEVNGFCATALGPMYSFEIVLPELSTSKASNTSANNVATTGTVTVGQRWVNLTGTGVNNTLILKAGDFFRFNTHSKMYMVTQDVTTSGSGTANVQFSGAAVSSVTSGTRIWTNGVPFTMVLDSPEQTFESTYGGISTLSLAMREVW